MKENNELTRDDIAIDHDMEVDCDEGRCYCQAKLGQFWQIIFPHNC